MGKKSDRIKTGFDKFNLDFDASNNSDFNFDLAFDTDFLSEHKNRYINPKPHKEIPEKNLYFDNALKLADSIDIKKNQVAHIILSGNFIMGDFIEAYFIKKDIRTRKLSISTLSMSQNNIDSLANLLVWNRVQSIDLIISDYFFSHERRSMIPYMLKELDIKDTFQLAVAGSHTKICLFETTEGMKMVIHGSSNLRSSNCTEQIVIEENSQLFDFYMEYHDRIVNEYKIINQSIRGEQLWQAVVTQKDQEAPGKAQQRLPEED